MAEPRIKIRPADVARLSEAAARRRVGQAGGRRIIVTPRISVTRQAVDGPTAGKPPPTCGCCGAKIVGAYWIAVDGFTACARCQASYPACDLCGHAAGPGHRRLPDGRCFCRDCQADPVTEPGYAWQLLEGCRHGLETDLGLIVPRPQAFHLLRPRELAAMHDGGGAAAGDDGSESERGPVAIQRERVIGLCRSCGTRTEVFLETGLPKSVAVGTLAHELVHVWQATHVPADQNLLLREGLAEYGSYLALGHHRLEQARARMAARTDVYGRGLALIRQAVARHGAAPVVDRLRRARHPFELD